MEWLEANPLPVVCENCEEEDCYNCDHAGERWFLPKVDELRLRRKGLERAIERMQQQIKEIDWELLHIKNDDPEEEPNVLMTQELWEHCLSVCIMDDNVEQYNKLWNEYPEYAESMMREFEEVATQSGYHVTEEESRASFERFKARMREEYGEDFI
jgi:hypothetical protein